MSLRGAERRSNLVFNRTKRRGCFVVPKNGTPRNDITHLFRLLQEAQFKLFFIYLYLKLKEETMGKKCASVGAAVGLLLCCFTFSWAEEPSGSAPVKNTAEPAPLRV